MVDGLLSFFLFGGGAGTWSTDEALTILLRAIADALTNDFKGKVHKGFQTLEEAESCLEQNGYLDWEVFINNPDVIQSKSHGRCQVYAVANGNKDGTYSSYQ